MRIQKPSYYDTFRCIASACPDSCCKEWDVQVDPQSAAYYRELPSTLGDRLRQVLRTENGETVITIVDGRCPMWRKDGLCRIQAELGEAALCTVCREFPRLRHDYGDFQEWGLELSCPEAARLILSNPDSVVTEEVPGGEAPEYDTAAMDSLLASREAALSLLHGEPREALAALLLFGYQAQDDLDWGEGIDFDKDAALETAASLAKSGDRKDFLEFFQNLEILTEQWRQKLSLPNPQPLEEKSLRLAAYLIRRYWLQAVSDCDLVSRVKFILICTLLVSLLGGNYQETAQLFSKEIENDADNVDALLDAAYENPAFTDEKLLGMLMG